MEEIHSLTESFGIINQGHDVEARHRTSTRNALGETDLRFLNLMALNHGIRGLAKLRNSRH